MDLPVKVPTHGLPVRVPTHGLPVRVPTHGPTCKGAVDLSLQLATF